MDPGTLYNKCIFVVAEATAEAMLEGRMQVPKENAAVALLMPQAHLQDDWGHFRPKQHQAFLQHWESQNVAPVQAWALQWGEQDIEITRTFITSPKINHHRAFIRLRRILISHSKRKKHQQQ